jgi:hypothetical protein
MLFFSKVRGEDMKTEVIAFRKDIAPNTTDVLHERVKHDGRVKEIRVRFYRGVEQSLKVRPFIEHKGNRIEEVFTYPNTAKPFLDGEDDYFLFPVTVDVEYDDYIKVWGQNTDATYTYTLVCDVVVEYEGGM